MTSRTYKILLAILLMVLHAGVLQAQGTGKLSAETKMLLHSERNQSWQKLRKFSAETNRNVSAFITVDAGVNDYYRLKSLGVKILSRTGDILVTTIPINKIESVAMLPQVRRIATGRQMQLHNDKARACTNIDPIHAGREGLPQEFTGKGVIVGVIDCGIDFQHPMFRDAEGNSRIKAAMIYKNGKDGDHYNYYYKQADIDTLSTDTETMNHGTHTTGTAAGSYKDNGYYGMAPEADLVLCGLQQLNEVALANALNFIIHYADSVGKPAVVNMSFGSISGPHDGTGEFINCLKYHSGTPGHILCMSAGNDGDADVCADIQFMNSGDKSMQAQMLLNPIKSAGMPVGMLLGQGAEIWSRDNSEFGTQIFLYDADGDSVLWESNVIYPWEIAADSVVSITVTPDECQKIATVAFVIPMNHSAYSGRFVTKMIAVSIADSSVYPGMRLYGRQGDEVTVWTTSSEAPLVTLGKDEFVKADNIHRINDLCSNDAVISVGAYTSRKGYTTYTGGQASYLGSSVERLTIGDIAYFSDYGTDMDGNMYPNVAAPGAELISSFSSYYVNYCLTQEEMASTVADSVMADIVTDTAGKRQYWQSSAGTSMSCPVVTGTMALWLQANPELTMAQARDVLNRTAMNDDFTAANPDAFGTGKLDALAGIKYILQEIPTSIASVNTETDTSARKAIRNGRIIITRDGHTYNTLGIEER